MNFKKVFNKEVDRRTFLKFSGALTALFSLGGLTSLLSKTGKKQVTSNKSTGRGYGA